MIFNSYELEADGSKTILCLFLFMMFIYYTSSFAF